MRGIADSKVKHQQEKSEKEEQEQENTINENDDDDDEFEDVYVSIVFPPQASAFENRHAPINVVASAVNGGSKILNTTTNGKDGGDSSKSLKESIEYKSSTISSVLPNKLRISGLSEPQPLFQTKNNVLIGEWSKLVGSELVFNENGDFITKVNGQILLKHGRLVENSAKKMTILEKALQRAKELDDEPSSVDHEGDVEMT